jgi:hypothetical protein
MNTNQIVALCVGLSMLCIILGVIATKEKLHVHNNTLFLKKWIYISLLFIINISGCVIVYYVNDTKILFYIIFAMKLKDILGSVMFACNMLFKSGKKLTKSIIEAIYKKENIENTNENVNIKTIKKPDFIKRLFTSHEQDTMSDDDDDILDKIIAFIPVYNEKYEQVIKTIDSVMSNDLKDNYIFTCIISEGVVDYIDIFDDIFQTSEYIYKSWMNESVSVKVHYGIRNNKGIMMIVKDKRRGKKDSFILCNDIFNHLRDNIKSSTNILRNYIREELNEIYNLNEFHYIFCTEADSVMSENTISSLVESIKSRNAVAACGIVNADISSGNMFWTNIQNYQYLYGQFMRRTNEDLMNQVTCLPGCISIFKIHDEAKFALEKYTTLPNENNLVQSNSQFIGTDRKYTSCLIQSNKNAKIIMDTNCNVFTIPPMNWSSFINQRRRWCSNMYFNTMSNILLPNMNIILRVFNVLDFIRLSLIYFRLFNIIYFMYLLIETYKNKEYSYTTMIRYVPLIVLVLFPTFCFLIYSLFNAHLRKQYLKFLILFLVNKIFTLISTLVIFTVMLININSFHWNLNKTKTKRYDKLFLKPVEDDNGFIMA